MKTRMTYFLPVLILLLHSAVLQAAPLTNIPQKLTQPDGSTVNCFASGDEYYHRFHDANDFTIIIDPKTGYWVYAKKSGDALVPTALVAGRSDPAAAGLTPGAVISPAAYQMRRSEMDSLQKRDVTVKAVPTQGTINGIVIFIRFSGESEYTEPRSTYLTMFNNSTAGASSKRNYFYEVSFQTLDVTATMYPSVVSTSNKSHQDSHSRSYYQPYDLVTNPDGYSGASEGNLREQTLLKDAVAAVASEIPSGLNIDTNGDDVVDDITFIISGNTGNWGDVLWPHMSPLNIFDARINGKRVGRYVLLLDNTIQVGVVCHESFHALGAPDLYHYTNNGISPVERWDLMDATNSTPQHMGAFMKYRYGKWIASIPEITSNGTYTLNPQTSPTNNCYKIPSPNSYDEYFVVEYRRKLGTFEGGIYGSGLLVYRIDPSRDGYGNSAGPPDEVYIYRPGGTLTANGRIIDANFKEGVGRTAITNWTNPGSFLSNGGDGGLFIEQIGPIGETISFYVGLMEEIGGMAYDGFQGPWLNNAGPYHIFQNSWTPSGWPLTVQNGSRIFIEPGVSFVSDDVMTIQSGSYWTEFFIAGELQYGMKVKGAARFSNGGGIKLY